MALRLRLLTAEEKTAVQKPAPSWTASARLVERAQLIWHAHQEQRVPAIAQQLGLNASTVRTWLKRLNEEASRKDLILGSHLGPAITLAFAPRCGR